MFALAPQSVWWTVQTEVFDGPLDLLLYLVRRDGVDLRTMPITPIADSYLAYLEKMRHLDLTLASGYLLLAATLCRLKSLELLPRPPLAVVEEEDDPREKLIRQVEAYEQVKRQSQALSTFPRLESDTFIRKPLALSDVTRPWVPGVDAFGLLDAYYAVLVRPEPVTHAHTIYREAVDLADCCRQVLGALGGVGRVRELGVVLRSLSTRHQRIVGFLGVLEMARLGWLQLVQSESFGPVAVTSRVPVDQDLSAVSGPALEAIEAAG